MTDPDPDVQAAPRGKTWLALPLVLLAGGVKFCAKRAPKVADEALEGSRHLADDALEGVRHVDDTGELIDRGRLTDFVNEVGTEGALELGTEAALGDDDE